MDEVEKAAIADMIPLFSELSAGERAALSDILILKKAGRKEMVVRDRQICHYMVYVRKGLLRQFYFKNGKEITEHFTCEGNIAYCIESIFKNKPSRLMMEEIGRAHV